jgi:hypothetical protein
MVTFHESSIIFLTDVYKQYLGLHIVIPHSWWIRKVLHHN